MIEKMFYFIFVRKAKNGEFCIFFHCLMNTELKQKMSVLSKLHNDISVST